MRTKGKRLFGILMLITLLSAVIAPAASAGPGKKQVSEKPVLQKLRNLYFVED